MKTLTLLSIILTFAGTPALPSIADSRPPDSTIPRPPDRRGDNPIRLEGQIREITQTDDGVTIRLHRDRYPIVAHQTTSVCWLDGSRTRVADLQEDDSIRVEGNLERTFISAERITLLRRIEHRSGMFAD